MKLLLLFLLLPACLAAQEVKPILSNDYLSLINKDSTPGSGIQPDTLNSMRSATLKTLVPPNSFPIRRLTTKGGYIKIQPLVSKVLMITGNFSSSVEIKRINRAPVLQSTYAQGESVNGAPSWRGPETGELFSYGPVLNTLVFDGSNYPYDVNGKLAPSGSGNGLPAKAYANNIFRTASMTAQSFNVQGRWLVGSKQVLTGSIKLGQTTENTFITANKNTGQNLLASLEGQIGKFSITGSYNYIQQRFSNSNRNGFLNRVYQNAILSPVSFDNTQGNLLGPAQQRSYSPAADNPFFLLDNNGNSYLQTHRAGSLSIGRNSGPLHVKLTQSLEALQQNSQEGYKPGTAFFQNGIATDRVKNDLNYFLKGDASADIDYGTYKIRSTAGLNYVYANNHSDIDYHPSGDYRYQRSSHDFSLYYNTNYYAPDYQAGLQLSNQVYTSNTSGGANFFLPAASGYIQFYHVLTSPDLNAKLSASVSNFDSELPIDRSFSSSGLLQYSTQQAFQYFPLTETAGFGNLSPIHHTDFTAAIDLFSSYKTSFRAEIFRQTTLNDVFPVLENGAPVLKNLADHRNDGIELQWILTSNIKKTRIANTISFFANQDKVTQVTDGYNYTPIAGFSDVHKALVKGEALGAIVGSSYLRDANNNMIIGSDGFPLVNPTPTVLGNPLPDFVIKMAHTIAWKRFSLAVDWEWKKGGAAWNGTQAVLDYYGRSQTTALLRNTTGYVFAGVTPNGHPNTIPVSFYDPSMPVENNRWARYGYSGVAESYIQKTDHLRINTLSLSYKITSRKYIQTVVLAVYANNIFIWSAYKGADPNQLLYDQPNTGGLDFFNLPSTKTLGFNVSVQF